MQFTNESILQTAVQQSAVDANCNAEDFDALYTGAWSNAGKI